MNNYLDGLPLEIEEKERLRQLAAPTPAALLCLIHASFEEFKRFFGDAQTEKLVACLTPMLSDEERLRLSKPTQPYPIQHSFFTESSVPVLRPAGFDIEERDRLFDQLRQLRNHRDPSPEVQQEIAALEKRLNALLG